MFPKSSRIFALQKDIPKHLLTPQSGKERLQQLAIKILETNGIGFNNCYAVGNDKRFTKIEAKVNMAR